MVTVIDNAPKSAMYEGMNLSTAADSMVLEAYQVVNDLKMDILLAEHAFLYENATEITYVDEAGEENNNAVSLKERIFKAVDNVRALISGLWDKFVSWLQDKAENIATAFGKIGVTKKSYEAAVENLKKNGGNAVVKVSKWALGDDVNKAIVSTDGFYNDIAESNHLYKPGEYFDQFAAKADEVDYVNPKTEPGFYERAGYVVFDMKGVISSVRKIQKDMDAQLNNIKKHAKIDKENNMSDIINKVGETLKSNANVAKDKIKLYNKNVVANLAIVKDVIRSSKSMDAKAAAAKKAEEAAKKANEKAENAAGKTTKHESFAMAMGGKYFAE